MATVFVALGSNLGDRRANLEGALRTLDAHPRISVRRHSALIETEPVGGPPDQPAYLNGVAELATDLTPHELLNVLHEIEADFGRRRSVPGAPRTLDLDLLLYDDLCINTPELTIPHPRMHERRFVLEPLAEIAPDARHPSLDKTVAEILSMI